MSELGLENEPVVEALQGQLVPAVTYFVGCIGCLAAPTQHSHVNSTLRLCINHAVWLLKDPLIQVNSIFSVVHSLVHAQAVWVLTLYMLPSHSQQLATDLLVSFLHSHQPQCGLGPQVLPSHLSPSWVFGAFFALLPPLSLGSFCHISHLTFQSWKSMVMVGEEDNSTTTQLFTSQDGMVNLLSPWDLRVTWEVYWLD